MNSFRTPVLIGASFCRWFMSMTSLKVFSATEVVLSLFCVEESLFSRCSVVSRTWFTWASPWRRVLVWLTVCVSMYRLEMLWQSIPCFKWISAFVALLGRPAHFLMNLSVNVSKSLKCLAVSVWTVKRKRFDGRKCLYTQSFYSLRTLLLSILSRPSLNVSLKSLNVSSAFPEKNSNFPRNFWTSCSCKWRSTGLKVIRNWLGLLDHPETHLSWI